MKWIFIEELSGCEEMYWKFFRQIIQTQAVRVEFFGDEIDRITEVDILTGEIKSELNHIAIFPASHYVVPIEQNTESCSCNIEEELKERVDYFKGEDKLLEAQRIAERTNFRYRNAQRNRFLFGH